MKINAWIAFKTKKKLSSAVKKLYDIDSKFVSGALLVFDQISF